MDGFIRLARPAGTHRFFFHYRKSDGRMSVHFQGQCIPCTEVLCLVPCESHRNKRQPRLVMRGFATQVTLQGTVALIE